MRASTIVMIGFAVVFGLLAVFIAQAWLNNQANMQAKNFEANKKPTAMQTVVVAKQPLRFGTELNASMLEEVPWPAAAMPSGAFSKIADVLHGGRRVVLTAIEPNEPVLSLKITGPGQRATLSALVHNGHEGGHHPRQRRRRRRRLRAARRPRRCRAHAPDRQGFGHHRGRAAERARAGGRPESPTSAPPRRRWRSRSRSK